METRIKTEQEAMDAIRTEFLGKSGWIGSYQTRRSIDAKENPLPWWSYPAISFVSERVNGDMRVFEWGSGYSTLWFAAHCASVTSVEDNSKWYERMKTMVPANVNLMHREPGAYSREIRNHGAGFDICIIDGAERNECAAEAAEALKGSAVVIFDNCGTRWNDGILHLHSKGWKKIIFDGIAPICTYAVRTAVFYRDGNCFGI